MLSFSVLKRVECHFYLKNIQTESEATLSNSYEFWLNKRLVCLDGFEPIRSKYITFNHSEIDTSTFVGNRKKLLPP